MSAPIRITDASLSFGWRTLWSGLDLTVDAGEFIAILGPNGSGKSTLLKVLLASQRLSSGSAEVHGAIGYIPQQGTAESPTMLRGRDVVGLGVDGHRWGVGVRGARDRRRTVSRALDAVGATAFASRPFARMSGGEQQRIRVAQALASDPAVLLCDEPLLSLDLASQRAVSEIIDRRRRDAGTAILFVTHEINPVLSYVDRVLYLYGGRFAIGKPDEVMTSQTLSELYGTPVTVHSLGGQIHVTGSPSAICEDEPHHHHEEAL